MTVSAFLFVFVSRVRWVIEPTRQGIQCLTELLVRHLSGCVTMLVDNFEMPYQHLFSSNRAEMIAQSYFPVILDYAKRMGAWPYNRPCAHQIGR